MKLAFFPGKFQPPHLGHMLTVVREYDKYDKIIIGITEDVPRVMTTNETKKVFDDMFKYMPKITVVIIKGILTQAKSLKHLPEFDICISGNEEVVKRVKELGSNAKLIKRTDGLCYSGTEIRKALNKWPDHIEKKKTECLYCKKQIMVMCGTPLITIGGCCYGYKDDKAKKQYIFPRKAHLECWLKEKKLRIKNE